MGELTFISKGSGFPDRNNAAYYEENNILNIEKAIIYEMVII